MTTIVPLHKEDIDAKKDLIKRTICRGSTDDELELFIHACKRTGLDPFMKQIHAVKRGDALTIQTGIDGLRLIADRTGNYAPGREPTFEYEKDGSLRSATSYIKKRTQDGTWHEVSATAFYKEYKPAFKSTFWDQKPHIMLPKCSEALALRKAFPAEMSGVYAQEEMEQTHVSPDTFIQGHKKDCSGLLQEFKTQNLNNVEFAEHFDEYVKHVQSKLKGRDMGEIVEGWISDPLPCLNYFSTWLEKNGLSDVVEINAEVC